MQLLFLSLILSMAAQCQDWNLIQQVPAKAAFKTNPMESDERTRRAGAKLFARECAACHGVNAEGFKKAPPLRNSDVHHAPAGTLFWILENGSLHRGMPSFAHLPEAQRWQIVTFLHSLAQKEE
jgi:mono/diheme cytochrome c family protein